MQLIEWLEHYIRFKDCMKKQIVEIKKETDKIEVKEKNAEKTYFVHDELDKLLNKTSTQKTYFVCLNSKQNIKTLLENWEKVITKQNLTILFVYPKSNDVWLISPTTHHKITEKESLKEGIESLHTSIPQSS